MLTVKWTFFGVTKPRFFNKFVQLASIVHDEISNQTEQKSDVKLAGYKKSFQFENLTVHISMYEFILFNVCTISRHFIILLMQNFRL